MLFKYCNITQINWALSVMNIIGSWLLKFFSYLRYLNQESKAGERKDIFLKFPCLTQNQIFSSPHLSQQTKLDMNKTSLFMQLDWKGKNLNLYVS